MQLVELLAAGVRGAENGTAELYIRGTATRASYYADFEATSLVAATTDVALDSYGRAIIYVNQLVQVVVKDANGATLLTAVQGNSDDNVEVISPSFTGVDYGTGASGVNKPTTLSAVLDQVITAFGAADWNMSLDGSSVSIQEAVGAVSGYFINVKSPTYGAVGDGVTDDTSEIQAALNAAGSGGIAGRIVVFPPGTYRITSRLSVPSGVNILGCGANRSSIVIDDSSDSALIFAGSTLFQQNIEGLSIYAAQSNTGSLIELSTAVNLGFVRCRIGDATNTVSISTGGMFLVGANGIAPEVSLTDCDIVVPTNFAGQVFTTGIYSATPILTMTACRVVWSGVLVGALRQFAGYRTNAVNCSFDPGAVPSGTVNILGEFAGASVTAVGNSAFSSGGADVNFINANGGVRVTEAGNYLGPNVNLVTLLSTTNGSHVLGSRRGRRLEFSHGSTTSLDLSDDALNAEILHITITSSDNFTLVVDPVEGLELLVILQNDAGGATGTMSWAGNDFAGRSAVTGTAPPTSIAAVGTIVAVPWVGLDGPDGIRWYPAGSSYAGT